MLTATIKAELNSIAPKALLFALYCFASLHAFAAPEVQPYASMFLSCCGLSFGLGISLALQSASVSFCAAGLKSEEARIFFGKKMLPLLRFSHRKFELTVIFFFLSLALLGPIKKNVFSWDFDAGHETIAPIFLVGGVSGCIIVFITL